MHRDKIRLYLFYLGIFLTIIGLPFSRALISFGQVSLAVLFLFDVNLIKKLKVFVSDKAALAFISIYIAWLIGLFYTQDMQFGLSDIRTKVPLLIFPLVFVTEPKLSSKAFTFFALLFSATVVASMATSLYVFFINNLDDFRKAFLFVSHIRLSLMALISMSILLFFVFKASHRFSIYAKIIMILAVVFLIIAQIILSLLSGLFILVVLLVVYSIRMIFNNVERRHLVRGLLLFVFGFVFIGWSLYLTVYNYNDVSDVDLNNLDKTTALGNKYEHHPYDFQVENGSYIGVYIQWEEMGTEWNKLSDYKFSGEDKKNQSIKYTVLRYLNSKHLRKDAAGIKQLTKTDIENIESGIANVEYAKKLSLKRRIYQLIWQYNVYKHGDGSQIGGHTILQRIELWSTGIDIISKNFIFGVGTGDINNAFAKNLLDNKSPMANKGLRSHNQYISTFVAIGVVGFVILLFSMIYPAIVYKAWKMPFFLDFFIIMSLSMLWEDTIESQVGVSIYAFIYMFYLYSPLSVYFKAKKRTNL